MKFLNKVGCSVRQFFAETGILGGLFSILLFIICSPVLFIVWLATLCDSFNDWSKKLFSDSQEVDV